jgi:hypothetical protein
MAARDRLGEAVAQSTEVPRPRSDFSEARANAALVRSFARRGGPNDLRR